jgi:serine/threonine-protein kinase
MSPEQIKGEKLTLQSDLFSAGVVIYELYKGTNPFLGRDVNHSINNITNMNENDFKVKLEGMPIQIIEAIERLIVRIPSHRFESAEEVLKLIDDSFVAETGSIIPSRNKKKGILAASVFIFSLLIIILFVMNFQNENDIPASKSNAELADNKNIVDDGSEINEKISEPNKLVDETKVIDKIPLTEKVIPPNIEEVKTVKVYGQLFVECIPWADVFIDGEKIETTPLKNNIKLEDGRYKLKLALPDFPVYENDILIEEDRLTTLRVNLDTLFGFIDFSVLPWGSVYLDDKYLGDTPFLNPLNVLPGDYKLKISNPNLGIVEDKIVVLRNDTIKYVHRFN